MTGWIFVWMWLYDRLDLCLDVVVGSCFVGCVVEFFFGCLFKFFSDGRLDV